MPSLGMGKRRGRVGIVFENKNDGVFLQAYHFCFVCDGFDALRLLPLAAVGTGQGFTLGIFQLDNKKDRNK